MAQDAKIKTVDMNGWWPSVSALLDEGIEIKGGVQKAGDLVICPTNLFHFGFALVSIFSHFTDRSLIVIIGIKLQHCYKLLFSAANSGVGGISQILEGQWKMSMCLGVDIFQNGQRKQIQL